MTAQRKSFQVWLILAVLAVSCGASIQKDSVELFYVKQHLGNKPNEGSVLILLHGYGSNEQDLMGLSAMFPSEGDVVSFRAPIRLGDQSYCWFPRSGHLPNATADTMAYHQATEILWSWIEQLKHDEGWTDRKIFLAGFSQGAMMSFEMARKHASAFTGIIGFSGSDKAMQHIKGGASCGGDILMTHGTEDNVLPYESALQAKARLEKCGAAVTLYTFEGGHQITQGALDQAKVWLKERW